MRLHPLLVVMMLAACGSAKPAPPQSAASTTSAAPDSGCPEVIEHLFELDPPRALAAADAPKFKLLVINHCENDSWSAELKRCMTAARSREDSVKCRPLLTNAQDQAVGEAIAPLLHATAKEQPAAAPPPPPTMQPAASSAPAPAAPKADAKRGARSGDPCDGGQ